MCYGQKWHNYGFDFLLLLDHKYIAIDCCDYDYYVEEFSTIQQAYMWLCGVEWHDIMRLYNYIKN